MPAGRSYTRPASYVTDTGDWPEGPFADNTPVYATATAALVTTLTATIATRGWSIRAVARVAGISHATLLNLLHGHTVPDLGTIKALEHALDTPLWPRHQPQWGTSVSPANE